MPLFIPVTELNTRQSGPVEWDLRLPVEAESDSLAIHEARVLGATELMSSEALRIVTEVKTHSDAALDHRRPFRVVADDTASFPDRSTDWIVLDRTQLYKKVSAKTERDFIEDMTARQFGLDTTKPEASALWARYLDTAMRLGLYALAKERRIGLASRLRLGALLLRPGLVKDTSS